MKGKVKWFDDKKGYGFITDENGVDRFFHYSDIVKGRVKLFLNKEDEINFDVGMSNDREAAVSISLIEE